MSALIENDRKCDANTKTSKTKTSPCEHLQNDGRLQSGDELRGTVSKITLSKLNAADSETWILFVGFFFIYFVSSMDFTRLFLSSGNRFYLVFRSAGDTARLVRRRPAEGKSEKTQSGSQMREQLIGRRTVRYTQRGCLRSTRTYCKPHRRTLRGTARCVYAEHGGKYYLSVIEDSAQQMHRSTRTRTHTLHGVLQQRY